MTRVTAEWLTSDATRAVTGPIQDAGHGIYFVGGCVRNALVGMPVSDLDLSTNARPETVIEIAQAAGLKVVPTGIDHGTVTVVSDHIPYEITTFRRDVETDGRRAVVAFSDNLEDDARRRDFTMNALYAAPDGVVVDPVGGLPDLTARRVRFIDDAEQRIREDYLRILRFFRFYAWFGDPIEGLDADGLAACAGNLEGLGGLARERVGVEILKTLAAPDPAPAIAAMQHSGVLHNLLPGADAGPLGVLLHLAEEAGRSAETLTRLAAITDGDVQDMLRLSNADTHYFQEVRGSATGELSPETLGYRKGADVSIQALLLRAAFLGQPCKSADFDAAIFGAKQVFPVTAADLMDAYSGPALGARLRQLESIWEASGFRMGRDALLEQS